MKLKPIIASGLLAGVLSAPLTTWALGLGKLTLQSALGEPLRAEIELVAAQKEELSSLVVKVADPTTYRANNLDYQAALSRVQISVAQKPDGRSYLRLASAQAVTEPYLALLIDLNWASGRLVREYTFLLDPPELAATQATEESPAIRGKPIITPVKPEAQAALSGATSAQTTTSPSKETSVASKENNRENDTSTYGPVKKGETLNKIAKALKSEGITTEQMLAALFRANKDAFQGGNMNRLKAGPTLQVPKTEEVQAITSAEAAKIIRLQTNDWQNYRGRVAQLAPKEDESTPRKSASGKLSTQVEEKLPAKSSKDQLKLSKVQPADAAKKGKVSSEDLIAKENALKESQERIKQLESTIAKLQALLAVKSEKGASLQEQSGKTAQATQKDSQSQATNAKKPEAPPAPQTIPAQPLSPANKASEPTSPNASPTQVPTTTDKPVEKIESAPTPTTENKIDKPASANEPGKPAETVKTPEQKADLAKKTPSREPSWMDLVQENLVPIGGGGALLALITGLWLLLRRRKGRSGFEESIITSGAAKTSNVFGHTSGGVINTNTQSFLTDFSREGLGNIDAGEVDPIAEAEVYLAYGRDIQAEEILRDALHKMPERQEIHLKLLEIYANQGKTTAFETLASELYTASNGQGPIWVRAAELGRQLDPNNPLYAGPTETGATIKETAFVSSFAAGSPGENPTGDGNSLVDMPAAVVGQNHEPPNLSSQESKALEVSQSPSMQHPELDFSLDFPETPADSAALGVGQIINTELNSGQFGGSSQGNVGSSLLQGANFKATTPTTDLNLEFTELVKASTDTSATIQTEKISGEPRHNLDFALPSLDFANEKTTTASEQQPAPPNEPKFNNDWQSIEATETIDLAPPGLSIEESASLPDLDIRMAGEVGQEASQENRPEWQEAATKLDLARAYQEMADWEGAREILQEVLKEGSVAQQQEAQELLAKLPA